MSFSNPLPNETSISGSTTQEQSLNALKAKYTDAAAWARWAGTIVEQQTTSITNALGTDIVSANIATLNNLIANAPGYNPTSLIFDNTEFSDTLLAALKNKLINDIGILSTGLGSAVETAMFNRATERVNAERAIAYTELTTQFSSRGFDMPTGALTAKQTEVNNETSRRAADISAAILHETAVLAQQYNAETLKVSQQLVGVLAQLNESAVLRNFEIKKTEIQQSLEVYKAQLGMFEVRGSLTSKAAQLAIEAALRETTVEIESFKSLAQSAAQMVASALNGVSVSGSFGWGGSESHSNDETKSVSPGDSVQYIVSGSGMPPA